MDILGKIKDWLTMGMVPLAGLAIASGIVLFAPMPLLQILGLDTVVKKPGHILAVLFFFQSAF